MTNYFEPTYLRYLVVAAYLLLDFYMYEII